MEIYIKNSYGLYWHWKKVNNKLVVRKDFGTKDAAIKYINTHTLKGFFAYKCLECGKVHIKKASKKELKYLNGQLQSIRKGK